MLGQLTALSLLISLMVMYFFLPPLLFFLDFDKKEYIEREEAIEAKEAA